MLNDIEKLKQFIIWCQENKVKSFKNKEIEFEVSEIAFIPETSGYDEINLEDTKTFSDSKNLTQEEYDDLLFHSSGG